MAFGRIVFIIVPPSMGALLVVNGGQTRPTEAGVGQYGRHRVLIYVSPEPLAFSTLASLGHLGERLQLLVGTCRGVNRGNVRHAQAPKKAERNLPKTGEGQKFTPIHGLAGLHSKVITIVIEFIL